MNETFWRWLKCLLKQWLPASSCFDIDKALGCELAFSPELQGALNKCLLVISRAKVFSRGLISLSTVLESEFCGCFILVLVQYPFRIMIPKHPWKSEIGHMEQILAGNCHGTFLTHSLTCIHVNSNSLRSQHVQGIFGTSSISDLLQILKWDNI